MNPSGRRSRPSGSDRGAGPVRVLAGLILALLLGGALGCSTVEYYQKERLSDPAMVFETDPTEIHFQQKCAYSMEGSAGGIGDTAGGGCGCY